MRPGGTDARPPVGVPSFGDLKALASLAERETAHEDTTLSRQRTPRADLTAASSEKYGSIPTGDAPTDAGSRPGRQAGSSCFRGVSWHSQTGRWKAQIKVSGRDINLGRHRYEMEAARAYDKAAICARGPGQAVLNFPEEEYADLIQELTSTSIDDLAAAMRGSDPRSVQQTSRFHGVRRNKRTSKYEAYIRVQGRHVHLGCHCSEGEAARCYDRAAIHRHLRSWLHADACPASAVASDEGPAGGASKPRAHRRSPPLNLNFPIETYADDLIWAAKTGLDDIALTFRHESTETRAEQSSEGDRRASAEAAAPNPRGPLPGWDMKTRRGGGRGGEGRGRSRQAGPEEEEEEPAGAERRLAVLEATVRSWKKRGGNLLELLNRAMERFSEEVARRQQSREPSPAHAPPAHFAASPAASTPPRPPRPPSSLGSPLTLPPTAFVTPWLFGEGVGAGRLLWEPIIDPSSVPTAPQATPTAPPLPVNSAAQGSVQGAEHSAAPPCLFRPVPIRVPTPASQPALPPALPSAFQPAFHAVAMQGRAQPLPHRHHGANAHPTANAGAPHRKGTGQIMAPAPANDSARSSFTVAWSRPGADGASASVFGRFAQPPGPLARSSCDTGATDTATLAPVGACQEAPTAPLGPWAGVAQSSRSRSVDLGSFASLSAFAGTKRSLCCVEDSVGDAADGPGCREPKRMSVDVWGMYGANGAGPAAGRGGDGGGVGKGKEESGMDISMRSALYMPAQGMSSGGSGGRA